MCLTFVYSLYRQFTHTIPTKLFLHSCLAMYRTGKTDVWFRPHLILFCCTVLHSTHPAWKGCKTILYLYHTAPDVAQWVRQGRTHSNPFLTVQTALSVLCTSFSFLHGCPKYILLYGLKTTLLEIRFSDLTKP